MNFYVPLLLLFLLFGAVAALVESEIKELREKVEELGAWIDVYTLTHYMQDCFIDRTQCGSLQEYRAYLRERSLNRTIAAINAAINQMVEAQATLDPLPWTGREMDSPPPRRLYSSWHDYHLTPDHLDFPLYTKNNWAVSTIVYEPPRSSASIECWRNWYTDWIVCYRCPNEYMDADCEIFYQEPPKHDISSGYGDPSISFSYNATPDYEPMPEDTCPDYCRSYCESMELMAKFAKAFKPEPITYPAYMDDDDVSDDLPDCLKPPEFIIGQSSFWVWPKVQDPIIIGDREPLDLSEWIGGVNWWAYTKEEWDEINRRRSEYKFWLGSSFAENYDDGRVKCAKGWTGVFCETKEEWTVDRGVWKMNGVSWDGSGFNDGGTQCAEGWTGLSCAIKVEGKDTDPWNRWFYDETPREDCWSVGDRRVSCYVCRGPRETQVCEHEYRGERVPWESPIVLEEEKDTTPECLEAAAAADTVTQFRQRWEAGYDPWDWCYPYGIEKFDYCVFLPLDWIYWDANCQSMRKYYMGIDLRTQCCSPRYDDHSMCFMDVARGCPCWRLYGDEFRAGLRPYQEECHSLLGIIIPVQTPEETVAVCVKDDPGAPGGVKHYDNCTELGFNGMIDEDNGACYRVLKRYGRVI